MYYHKENNIVGGIILIVLGACFIFPFLWAAVFQNILLILGIYLIYLGFCKIQKNIDRH